MFNDLIKQQCPEICSYFEKVINNDIFRLPPSIILWGENSELCYKFAQELARLANCLGNKTHDCNCINCKWIREDKHPSVKTFSNLENKNDKSKTVISEEQCKEIIEDINISSEYKRFYILCAAQTEKDDNGEKYIKHLPLDKKILPPKSANSLLKSIEEPPSNTYFIFITRDNDDLIPTIVSRSQAFYISTNRKPTETVEGIDNVFKYYPYKDYTSSREFITNLSEWGKKNELSTMEILEYAQEYLNSLAKANITNVFLTNKITSDIIKFEDAKRQAVTYFKDSLIWDNLSYKIYKD